MWGGEIRAKLGAWVSLVKGGGFLARRHIPIAPPTQRHSGPPGEWPGGDPSPKAMGGRSPQGPPGAKRSGAEGGPWGLRSRATPRCPGVAGVWGGHGVQGRQPLPANR